MEIPNAFIPISITIDGCVKIKELTYIQKLVCKLFDITPKLNNLYYKITLKFSKEHNFKISDTMISQRGIGWIVTDIIDNNSFVIQNTCPISTPIELIGNELMIIFKGYHSYN